MLKGVIEEILLSVITFDGGIYVTRGDSKTFWLDATEDKEAVRQAVLEEYPFGLMEIFPLILMIILSVSISALAQVLFVHNILGYYININHYTLADVIIIEFLYLGVTKLFGVHELMDDYGGLYQFIRQLSCRMSSDITRLAITVIVIGLLAGI